MTNEPLDETTLIDHWCIVFYLFLGNEKTRIFSKKLQLLSDITGVVRPGVLTALMGPNGAGITTLLGVLAGRKTIGCIEGEIRVGGCPKVQETFAKISGFCEQTDIHCPQITVEESLIFSAWLRLPACIDSKMKTFGCKCCSIVVRAVKNVADTGRTIVCTIHQPSIDIFEAFDELIFLKTGGSLVYFGPLGQHSSSVIEYFESIPGVPKIKDNCNPATWMLDVTSTSVEAELGIDLAKNENTKVVDLVVLCNDYILDIKLFAHFTIWRCE
ncbi:Pleiotropic drug resistance 2 [Theobroma cacao]|uniref:Pleiotropic drug resistance 2 n=1 Tax=Theobroma cacao TaxID=3641 RepID=A0A061GNU9_THECC|nr:Pleiotropic drug resistance 2 [Theobroma cacao]